MVPFLSGAAELEVLKYIFLSLKKKKYNFILTFTFFYLQLFYMPKFCWRHCTAFEGKQFRRVDYRVLWYCISFINTPSLKMYICYICDWRHNQISALNQVIQSDYHTRCTQWVTIRPIRSLAQSARPKSVFSASYTVLTTLSIRMHLNKPLYFQSIWCWFKRDFVAFCKMVWFKNVKDNRGESLDRHVCGVLSRRI